MKEPSERPDTDLQCPESTRMRDLVVPVMDSLARVFGPRGGPARRVGWLQCFADVDPMVARGEEGVIEAAHFIADLAAVDGAVVLTKNVERLGFGGQVSGAVQAGAKVNRALDAGATRTQRETTEHYGIRHRPAYRLCNALPQAITSVVSQDGSVRWFKSMDGQATCWDRWG